MVMRHNHPGIATHPRPADAAPRHPGRGGRARDVPKGRQLDPAALAEVEALLAGRAMQRDLLIEHLHVIQDTYGRISAAHLAALAGLMRLSLAEVFEVATFYAHFDVVKDDAPVLPKLVVRVCDSIACAMSGADALLGALQASVGVPRRGWCARRASGCATRRRRWRSGTILFATRVPRRCWKPSPTATPSRICLPYVDYAAYVRRRRLPAARIDLRRGAVSAEQVLAVLDDAQLRGLGGAGFPLGRKWRSVRGEPGPRLMAVNGDEGEPGTFKDRHYLNTDPHRFLEGMLIGAHVVEATDVYIYLRDEYPAARAILAAELPKLPPGGPRLHLRRGAGAYICGEESAMLESLEGKRGVPRHKPPFPFQVGLFGRPTLINNVETLYWVRDLVERGAGLVARLRPQRTARAAQFFGVRPGARARREAGAGRHHRARADRRVLRRHAAGPPLRGVSARRRLGRHPAGIAGRCAAGFRHAGAIWLLHRLGGRGGAVRSRRRARRRAEPDAFLRRRELRQMHALPHGHAEGARC